MTAGARFSTVSKSAVDLPVRLFQAFVVLLIAVKIAHAAVFPATEDEAYYWLWGQHLDFSYFDHAPLVGWAAALFDRLFGWNLLALRAGNFITLVGIALIIRHWAKRFAPEDWRRTSWAMLAIYLASPLVFGITSLAYPDAWLILFSLLSAHFFGLCFAAQMEEGRLSRRDLYLGALFLGLAALAKYNAVLLGVAVALTVIVTPRLRPLLRSPHLYLAALLSIAVLAPILYWNAAHDFVSLRFQLYERHGEGSFAAINWYDLIRFCIVFVLYASPFLFVPIVAMMVRRADSGLFGALQRICAWSFVLALAMVLWFALFVPTAPHWAVVGLVIPISLSAWFFVSRWLVLGHLVFGTLVNVAVAAYYMHYAFVNFGGDGEATRFYGWDQVGARMSQLAAEHGAVPTLAAHGWQATSKIGFALRTIDVTSLSPAIDQYDFWRNEEALAGRDMVIVDEFGVGVEGFAPMFERVLVLETYDIMLFGTLMRSYNILIGRGYRPQQQFMR